MKKIFTFLFLVTLIFSIQDVTAAEQPMDELISSEIFQTEKGLTVRGCLPVELVLINKIFKLDEWKNFNEIKIFNGNKDDLKDGFIHFSKAAQVEKTRQNFFASEEQVVVACIDPYKLNEGILKLERNAAGGNKYFHLYGNPFLDAEMPCIPLTAVTGYMYLARGKPVAEGVWENLP